MGIFTRFTLRSLAKNRVRTAVTVAGIALSTALLAAVLTSVGSMQAALLQRTMDTEGSWHVFSSDVSGEALEAIAADDRTVDIATFEELGSALLSDEEAHVVGEFVAVRTLPRAMKGSFEPNGQPLAIMPEIVEGRLPESADEVVLPDYARGIELGGEGARTDGPLAVGSELALDLGTRLYDNGVDGPAVLSSVDNWYRSPERNSGDAEEELVDISERTYRVVGFYERQPNFPGNNFAASSSSIVALAAPGQTGGALTGAYVRTQGIGSLEDMKAFMAGATGTEDFSSTYFHTNLFRYLGISDGRPIWGTLWMVAAVLAVVIVAASVSLIYNAFAISVAERTRQFGLLASLGASKRQLRRTVIAEALVLGLVGVPLGLVLGLGGTAGAFALSQEAFTSLVGTGSGVPVHVDAAVLAAAAALSLATLVASAWVPALRAARVSAVDAIRQTQDVRLSKRAGRKAGAGAGTQVRMGAAGKLFGVPGFVAHRNLSRSAARGRTVVSSLAVSVVLIVATGSLADAMAPISDRAARGGAASEADIVASAHVDTSASGSYDLSDHGRDLDLFLEDARTIEGLELLSSTRQGQAEGIVPAAMIASEMKDVRERLDAERNADYVPSSFNEQGDYLGYTALFYLDDASWRALLAELGLDEAAYTDPENPHAIGLNTFQDTFMDGTYASTAPFAGTGSIDLYAIDRPDGFSLMGILDSAEGPLVSYLDITDPQGPAKTIPLEDVATAMPLKVGALANKEPDALSIMGASNQFPAFILPESVAVASSGDYRTNPFTYSFASFSFKAADHAKAADELEKMAAGFDGISINVSDLEESARQDRLTTQAIQLFVMCFSVIMALIAVANVFNTLANSIILRTREFAVLKSVGMGGRAFARMLACECASYAARGLAIGLAAATAVAWALHQATALAFEGLAFSLPWPYVGAAVGMVLAVLALSVAYALARARAGSIVEALRADAI
ncbi:ABC transporter permease [Gordonibacter urolithinfaciens]|uniref:ABC transporter permease n=1 Tax=Gordonibacter urolithinfaciens TaxID=1335613 RepID=UPI000F4B8767|nr:ABC transporter permease [Gordonibacter urolithinfaciens]ROT92492.1 ABC transporter permease [Gordonibacter urolithinfaciens]GKG90557.1 permease [Gordonibacter pamelaeae]